MAKKLTDGTGVLPHEEDLTAVDTVLLESGKMDPASEQVVPATNNDVVYYTDDSEPSERDVPVSVATGSLDNFGR